MNSYLLPVADQEMQQRLHDAGVTFYEWKTGIIFPTHEEMSKALKVLGAIATESNTEFANVLSLELIYPRQNGEGPEREKARAVARTRYIQACSRRIQEMLEQTKSELTAKRKSLIEVSKAFFDAARAEFMSQMRAQSTSLDAYLQAQFDCLTTTSGVVAVNCQPNKVFVYTDTIYTTSILTLARIELGRFMIEITLDGGSGPIRFLNATRRIDAFAQKMHAPNVYASGECCLEEVQQVWLELIARFELAPAVELAIQLLEESGKDPLLGRYADMWPRA